MFSLNPLPHFSRYNGPHKVGSTEYEIPISELQSTVEAPEPQVTTIKFRIFYPTTTSATSKQSIPWLPTPQKTWNQAYAQFMGISEKKASWLSILPSLLNYITIPAIQNSPLLSAPDATPYPVVIFSHGLGGNYNAYSSFLGSLASCGVVCVAPEHRDGSAPVSLIKSSREKVETTIAYKPLSHSPTPDVLNARNSMLRVRLWEMELVHTAIREMNAGKHFTNFADTVPNDTSLPNFQNVLNIQPGRVTWAGHSFGAATTVQLVKSVYYYHDRPQSATTNDGEWDMRPIYTPQSDNELTKQITPDSPTILLDLWTMPLRGEVTRWLWERPLPCYSRQPDNPAPNVISIMSAEFYKWPDLRNRTRIVLSADPSEAVNTLHQVSTRSEDLQATTLPSSSIHHELHNSSSAAETDLHEPAAPGVAPHVDDPQPGNNDTRTPSPARSAASSTPSSTSFTSDPSTLNTPALLYHIPSSAHLSQSDFGPLFPTLTRYAMKALDPEKTMELNVRAALAMIRGRGLSVSSLKVAGSEEKDRILESGVKTDRFERIELVE